MQMLFGQIEKQIRNGCNFLVCKQCTVAPVVPVLCLSFPGARTGMPAGAGALVALCSWKGSSTLVVLVQEVWPPQTRKRLARVLCLWLAGSRLRKW